MKCSKLEVGGVYPTNYNGKLKVVRKLKNNYYLIKFLDTGYTTTIRADSIRNGIVKDWLRPSRFGVGYLGVGTYASTLNKKRTKAATIWMGMLKRCYCATYHKECPTYIDCTVTPEWHNFQIFAKWFYENYPKDGKVYELDKDLRVKGNRIYSPDTCTFLSQRRNKEIAHAKDYKFLNPEGELVEITNLAKYCSSRDLLRGSLSKVHRGKSSHHKGWTKYVE